jgi:hypothetical protein
MMNILKQLYFDQTKKCENFILGHDIKKISILI